MDKTNGDDKLKSNRPFPRISGVSIHPVGIPRVYKTKVSAAGGLGNGKTDSLYLLIELTGDNGCSGVGEISDIESTWNIPSLTSITKLIEEHVVGASVSERRHVLPRFSGALPEDMHHEMKRMIATAVDMAMMDLTAKSLNIPLYELFGGKVRQAVPVSWVAYIRETAYLAQEIQEKVDQGFNAFKLKIGDDFSADYEHIETIRRIAGQDAYLKLDASGAWEEKEAIENIRTLAKLNIDAVETPLHCISRSNAKHHPEKINGNPQAPAEALARVREAVQPVRIIEHIVDFSDGLATELIRRRSVDIFNIAVSQAGSLERALRLIHTAEAAGIDVLIGSTVELGPGTAVALQVGCACPAITIPSDLVGPGLLVDDVITTPFEYRDSMLTVPDGPGLGVVLDRRKLQQYRKER